MGLYLDALNENFKDLVTSAGPYVDKSLILSLINQNIKRNNKYICITRPCRFGKSLTASMLTAYYSKAFDSHFLFDNLKIAKEKTYLEYLNKYHTIFINITDVFNEKDKNINAMIQDLTSYIVKEMSAFNPKISFSDLSALYLCLNDFYLSEKEKFVIVIDEWDAPMRENKEDVAGIKIYLE